LGNFQEDWVKRAPGKARTIGDYFLIWLGKEETFGKFLGYPKFFPKANILHGGTKGGLGSGTL